MRKGFTLVEIILSIGLIVIVGTISIFSFNIVKKNNKTKTLESMSDTILTAVNLYVETNNDVKEKLYNNKNGLKIPLTTLENAGLVDFENIELDEEDFVVTMLGSGGEDDDHCANTYTAKSWNITSGETIYICEKSNGSQNLITVAGDADNLSKSTRETYYFRGGNAQNYIQLNGSGDKYRIISIEKDDSLILYYTTSFGSVFNGLTQPIAYVASLSSTVVKPYCIGNKVFLSYSLSTKTSGEVEIDQRDLINSAICSENKSAVGMGQDLGTANIFNMSFWIPGESKHNGIDKSTLNSVYISETKYRIVPASGYKIHLKSCMKITSGTGDYATPYVLKNNC